MSRVRLAAVKTHDFFARADAFAAQYPRYQKDGKADVPHILAAAELEGFHEITWLNLGIVFAALERRAAGKPGKLAAAGTGAAPDECEAEQDELPF